MQQNLWKRFVFKTPATMKVFLFRAMEEVVSCVETKQQDSSAYMVSSDYIFLSKKFYIYVRRI